MTRLKAELILLFIATLWAGTFPVIKISVDTFPPFLFISTRFFIAAVLFTIIYFRSIPFKSSPSQRGVGLPADLSTEALAQVEASAQAGGGKAFKAGLILAIFQLTGFGSQTLGMVYTSASNSALITGICILFVPFVQYIIIKKSLAPENWVGVAVVTIGLYLLTQPFERGFNTGDLITLICTLSWAFYIVLLDPYSKKYNINILIFVQFWFVAIVSLIISLIFENYSSLVLTTTDYYAIIYMGIAATLVTTTLGNRYQKYTTPIRASIIFTWEQPAAVMLAIFFLGEKFGAMQLIGGVLMIAGILFSETFEYFRKKLFPIKESTAI